jgi:uncharacterized protein (TIGR02246 family)
MRRSTALKTLIPALAVITLCALTVAAQATGAAGTRAADEAAIRENVRQMESAWNTKSGAVFAKPFAEDADYVVINGMHLRGRSVIEKSHQQIFDTIFKETTIRLSVKQVRFFRPDVAVVHVNAHRDGPENEISVDALISMVMTRDKDGWKIAAFQNTQIVNTSK